jgi:hypothetical protein
MANGHGGPRTPAHPAPVSGPGALSQRTDGGPGSKTQPIAKLPDAGYGEQAQFRSIQAGAPIQKVAAPGSGAPSGVPSGPLPPPLDAPTSRADEPITAGVDMGAGPGSDVLGLFDPSKMTENDIRYMKAYLPTLQYIVDSNPHADTITRALVRSLRALI